MSDSEQTKKDWKKMLDEQCSWETKHDLQCRLTQRRGRERLVSRGRECTPARERGGQRDSRSDATCFECGKKGHFSMDCRSATDVKGNKIRSGDHAFAPKGKEDRDCQRDNDSLDDYSRDSSRLSYYKKPYFNGEEGGGAGACALGFLSPHQERLKSTIIAKCPEVFNSC
eukprot:3691085-Rhodomonas_salina.1